MWYHSGSVELSSLGGPADLSEFPGLSSPGGPVDPGATGGVVPGARRAGPGGRIVIISASVGAGHDGAAAELADRLCASGYAVDRLDFLDLLPARLGRAISAGYHRILTHAPGAYQRIYAATERAGGSGPGARALLRSAERRTLQALRADTRAVVSTYFGASQVLGALRLRGRLAVPAITYLTDFSVHPLWVAAGVDFHLAAHDIPAAQARARGAARVLATGPVVAPRFKPATDRERQQARARFGLPPTAPLALLVAGSWGVGPIQQVACEIRATGAAVPVVVCGRNETLAGRLRAAGIEHAYGWVKDMPGLMHAADVLVQNAGGLTSLEAFAAGLPVASYGCIPGHGHTNAAALHDAGLATWVREPADLKPVLTELLDGPLGESRRAAGLALFATAPDSGPVAAILRACGAAAPDAGDTPPPSRRLSVRRSRRAARRLVVTGALATALWGTAVGTGIAATHSGGSVRQVIGHSLDHGGHRPDLAALASSVEDLF
ncbi:MGDG synthase family glycosyltransferase [Streptomyces violaceusniger]|uniref:Monogalactosyldiacylglycerol synthase n=1 Tax=Streptomyces violaceusniger (strain Tu 4113) TaxID=653045 RepID=G2P2P9_STRV4|nr:galactosyldiacylglycerol synthase [Streptomyces violaceusniger]AEM82172.1 monogalactosyldiacylglycerol synthase [Streptomyces violaceusniger Tu 4113]